MFMTRMGLVVCLYIGLLAGCASTSAQQQAADLFANPEPLPDAIARIRFGNQSLCTDVKIGFFEDAENTPSDIGLDQLIDRVAYHLDSRQVKVTGLGHDRFDFHSCFYVDHLPEGYHLATINLTRFSGESVTYSWAFRVDGNLTGLQFKGLAEQITLPSFPE